MMTPGKIRKALRACDPMTGHPIDVGGEMDFAPFETLYGKGGWWDSRADEIAPLKQAIPAFGVLGGVIGKLPVFESYFRWYSGSARN